MFKNLLLRNHKGDEAETWLNIFSETIRGMKLKLGIHVWDISLYKSCVFYSGRIRTLVAMATFSSHRLIMGKLEIDSFCCLTGDI